jgi:mRNA-degrading endonuclease RelE of RelBE toxin-antitoxin system
MMNNEAASQLGSEATSAPKVNVSFTPEFKKNLQILSKFYRSIRSDITPLLQQIEKGMTPGDKIPHTGHTVFMVRLRNSDIQKGKRSGYRVIYYVQTSTSIILITVYSKLEQGDISADEIRRIITEHDNQSTNS